MAPADKGSCILLGMLTTKSEDTSGLSTWFWQGMEKKGKKGKKLILILPFSRNNCLNLVEYPSSPWFYKDKSISMPRSKNIGHSGKFRVVHGQLWLMGLRSHAWLFFDRALYMYQTMVLHEYLVVLMEVWKVGPWRPLNIPSDSPSLQEYISQSYHRWPHLTVARAVCEYWVLF